MSSWCDDHDQILKALMRKDPQAAKLAMWQHLENTRQMLFQGRCEQVPDMRSCLSSGAMKKGSS
uniref:FCD domain-containing protein n=1 Tax=Aeromonas caviae TaxID=648 RepID=UPI00396B1E2C